MFAPTAHYLMQVLTSFLSCNPKEVLHLASEVVKSSERFGYTLDSIAVHDVVDSLKLSLLTTGLFLEGLREPTRLCLQDLLNLLDMFPIQSTPVSLYSG